MKVRIKDGRVYINVTRNEALLLQDALYEFQADRSETNSWDSQNDPIVVSQMCKKIVS